MFSSQNVWSLLMGVFIIAIVFMLVRPGAPAAKAVADVTNALANMITNAIHGLPSAVNKGTQGQIIV